MIVQKEIHSASPKLQEAAKPGCKRRVEFDITEDVTEATNAAGVWRVILMTSNISSRLIHVLWAEDSTTQQLFAHGINLLHHTLVPTPLIISLFAK